MKQMADEIFEMYMKKKQQQQNLHKKNNNEPQQQPQQEPLLVFHIPPFHSVHHLHLHVLDGASLDVWGRIKYPATTTTRYCITWQAVVERLRRGQPPTPYYNYNSTGTGTAAAAAASSHCGAACLWGA